MQKPGGGEGDLARLEVWEVVLKRRRACRVPEGLGFLSRVEGL